MDRLIKVILIAQTAVAAIISILALIYMLMGNSWLIIMVALNSGITWMGLYSIRELEVMDKDELQGR